jgi:hypothetical protein
MSGFLKDTPLQPPRKPAFITVFHIRIVEIHIQRFPGYNGRDVPGEQEAIIRKDGQYHFAAPDQHRPTGS